MLNLTRSLTFLVGSAIAAGSIHAAELDSTTRAPIQNIFPNAYSSVELSHHFKSRPKKADDTVRVDATYTLGSTFFNGMLDSLVTAGVKKHTDSGQFFAKSVNLENYLTVYNNGFVELQPYLLASLPYTDHEGNERSTEGQFGLKVPVKYELSTRGGAVSFGGYYDVSGKINNRSKVSVLGEDDEPFTRRDRGALGLTDEREKAMGLTANDKGEYEVSPRALGVRQDAAVELGYTPNFATGLSLEWRTRHRLDSTPVMAFNNESGTVAPRANRYLGQDYVNAGKTTHRLRAKYEVNEVIYLQNDFDFANRLADNNKLDFTNMFAVGATLF